MEHKFKGADLFLAAILLGLVILAGTYFLPWQSVSWGKLKIGPSDTVTVVGQAKSEQRSQIASFTAGATSLNDDKQVAVNDVNRKVSALVEAAKTFGIPEADIQTQNLNVYQNEEQYYDDSGRQKMRPGQWRVSTDVQIKLRDVNRASELADLLTKSGATNIYGPSFTLDDTEEAENALVEEAIKSAREKAGLMAKASGRKLGKIISVSEGSAQSPVVPFYRMEAGGGGGADLQPGTETVVKTLTVTFELQ